MALWSAKVLLRIKCDDISMQVKRKNQEVTVSIQFFSHLSLSLHFFHPTPSFLASRLIPLLSELFLLIPRFIFLFYTSGRHQIWGVAVGGAIVVVVAYCFWCTQFKVTKSDVGKEVILMNPRHHCLPVKLSSSCSP